MFGFWENEYAPIFLIYSNCFKTDRIEHKNYFQYRMLIDDSRWPKEFSRKYISIRIFTILQIPSKFWMQKVSDEIVDWNYFFFFKYVHIINFRWHTSWKYRLIIIFMNYESRFFRENPECFLHRNDVEVQEKICLGLFQKHTFCI